MPKNKFVDYNEIVLCRGDFGDDLWNVVGQQISILTKAGNICVVYDDDVDIIVIQYEHDDTHLFGKNTYFGACNPKWLTPEESRQIDDERIGVHSSIESDISPIDYN